MYIIKCILVATLLAGRAAKGDEDSLDLESTSEEPMLPLSPGEPEPADPDLTGKFAVAMDDFLATADIVEKQVRDGVLHTAETSELYLKMTEALDEILDLLDNTDNAYYFLTSHGFDAVVAPHLDINYAPLRSRLIQLTKTLFNIAPTTTKAVIPSRILDALLDVFETDENLSLKTQAIELLSVWLPENPQAQSRVMKLKGLEPFYAQISKLDSPAIGSILQLFSRIINEHEAARENRIQKSRADFVQLRMYQQIGLLERISTPPVCKGLLNVFAEMWAMSKTERELLPPVLGLLRAVRPHCAAVYRGREQAVLLFTQMAKFIQNPTNNDYFDKLHLNVTELTQFFDDFITQVTVLRREEL